jgi:uroporphyrinogen decarboxylase
VKQEVIDAINHKSESPVPWNIDLTSGFTKKTQQLRGCRDVDQYFENHIVRVKYKKNRKLDNGVEIDLFGVPWTFGADGGDVGMVTDYPLQDTPIEDFQVPELDTELCDSILQTLEHDNTDRFRMFNLTMNFYERSWSLRGMERVLMDMILDEEGTFLFYEKLLEHHMRLLDYVLDADYEGVYFGDDWGSQNGLIMGPDLWRKFIKPPMTKMFEKVKSMGKFMILHSCGDLRSILGDLIEMGLDVYNTVQPEIYNLEELKREYGRDLTFWGAVSTQQFLPYATTDEVYKKSIETLKVMAPGGGYIFAPTHAVTDDIPVENIETMVQAVKDFNG